VTVAFDPVPAIAWSVPVGGPVGFLDPVLALLQACSPGLPARRARLVAFATDHPVTDLAVSAHPAGVTGARLAALNGGSGPLAEAAAAAGVGLRTVDLTAAGGFTGTGRIDVADALTAAALDVAMQAGKDAADAEIDGGADVLIGSTISVGVSTPAAALAAALTGMEPVDATSRGSGIGDAAWIRKTAAVRDALYRASRAGSDAGTLLRVAGGADLAALTAFLAQAAVRRTPVLIDDVPSTVAAVLAHRLAPGADGIVVAAARAEERSHTRLLELLGREPLTSWSLRTGGGFGALLMVPALRAAGAVSAAPGEPTTADAVADWDPHLL
jgi:nicotinate-nucleotide--dimethylbenzimidazole phosphoribosyltransferase